MRKKYGLWFCILVGMVGYLIAGRSLGEETHPTRGIGSDLCHEVRQKGFVWGARVFIRIFKESRELEMWLRQKDGTFGLFKIYSICSFSGSLGPKIRQGDCQSPEGFYLTRKQDLRAISQYYKGFFIDYPNAYDQSLRRTGGWIMIHGKCVSIGCYAMSDEGIEEIYGLVKTAFKNGQPAVAVHIFPFRMSGHNLEEHLPSGWSEFWRNLKTGYDVFEKHKIPPAVAVKKGRYFFKAIGPAASGRAAA